MRDHLAEPGCFRAHTEVVKQPEGGRGDQARRGDVVSHEPAIVVKDALHGPRRSVAVVPELLTDKGFVDAPEADDRVNALSSLAS